MGRGKGSKGRRGQKEGERGEGGWGAWGRGSGGESMEQVAFSSPLPPFLSLPDVIAGDERGGGRGGEKERRLEGEKGRRGRKGGGEE